MLKPAFFKTLTDLKKTFDFKSFKLYRLSMKWTNWFKHLCFFLTFVLMMLHGVSYGESYGKAEEASSRNKPFSLKPKSLIGGKSYVETARLQIKPGLLFFFTGEKLTHFDLLLDLQIPILTAEGNIKWLLRAGGGYNRPSFFQGGRRPRFCSDFSQESRSRHTERYKECDLYLSLREKNTFLYLKAQTGLQYELKPLTISLLMGSILGGQKKFGWQGSLIAGWKMLDFLILETGAEALYYDNMNLGFSIGLVFLTTKWMSEFSF